MKPPPFEYVRPGSLDEALGVLALRGGDARPLAGGQSLVPMLNFRLLEPAVLVDLNGLTRELGTLALTGDGENGGARLLRVGALVRHRCLERSPELAGELPIVPAAVGQLAHLAIRNRGTFGGSLANADPAAELPLLCLLLDGVLVCRSSSGERRVPAGRFFTGPLETDLAPGELLTEGLLRVPPAGAGWAFLEVARRHGDFALVAVAVVLELSEGTVRSPRIAVGGAGPTPWRARGAEHLLEGQAPREALIGEAARLAASEAEPESDLHASAGFRRHLVRVLTGRALTTALGRAGPEGAALRPGSGPEEPKRRGSAPPA